MIIDSHTMEPPRRAFRIGGLLLILLLALYGISLRNLAAVPEEPKAMQLIPLQEADGTPARLNRDGTAVLLHADEHAAVEMRFVLPPRDIDSPHWVLWVRRIPVESLRLSAGERWRSPDRSFLAPAPGEGPMPVGYFFRLPATWEGEISVRMDAVGLRTASLRPELMTEDMADAYLQRSTMIATAAYASLLTLGLVALALFFASHDWGFLSLFGFIVVALVQVGIYSGHLYGLDPTGALAALGAAGLQAISLVFEAAALRILMRYTDLGQARPDMTALLTRLSVALLLIAGVALALRGGSPIFGWALPVLWAIGGVACLWVMVDALRRKVPLAGAVMVSTLAVVLAVVLSELAAYGTLTGTLATYYGHHVAIVLSAAMVGVGLISRISRYREQRDREQRARADSERRMYREAVRSELLTALQMGLRNMPQEDIQPVAFRLLLEHLRRIVPTTTAVVVARGYHGRDTLVVQPAAYFEGIETTLGQRLQALRLQLGGAIELQRPVTRTSDSAPVAIEALVALPVRAPAWGLVILERSGATVFHPEELNIARELARLTVMQVEEAAAAQQLRRTAEVDALTGALNRRSLDQSINRSFMHAHRDRQPWSVLFLDIDHFKSVNDRHGHACGDHCLREVAALLRRQLGDEDIFGRYGGEEFMVVLPGRQTEMARAIAEQLRASVENADLRWQDQALRLTISVGVATHVAGEAMPQPTVERADKALYSAKRSGRNRVKVAPAVFQPRTPA